MSDYPEGLDERSPSVQAHLGIIQSTIQRMSLNSASCKTWCVTIVAAVIVLIADRNKPALVWVAIFPALIFAALDTYYLALEKGFRSAYEGFVRKLHIGRLMPEDLYTVQPRGSTREHQRSALKSFSIWGFYLSLIALAILACFLALGAQFIVYA